jgi:hypothetical protein
MALFKGLIFCSLCKKKHRAKMQRKTQHYICSTYNNKGKEFCQRNPVSEEILLDYLELRIGEKPTEEYIRENVELVVVDPEKIVIHIKDETEIIVKNNFVQIM